MQFSGIVCEYNPFHQGHRLQILKTRALLGSDTAVICVMSGNFVQRGEAAVMRKHARAKAAVKCGADLVIELPLPWAVSSAEHFAEGAVSIMRDTGLVTHISFGSECGDIDALLRLRDAYDAAMASNRMKEELKKGKSFAAAREAALFEIAGDETRLLQGPNNILAFEYLKAIKKLGASIEPVTVKRVGAGHDEKGAVGQIASAGAIREMIKSGENFEAFMPKAALEILKREIDAGRAPVFLERAEDMLLYRLRTMTDREYMSLPDSGEGLWKRFSRFSRQENTVSEVLDKTKTKRYAYSRIRRMALSALLGISADMTKGLPPYIRVLAVGEGGRAVLSQMKKTAKVPIITKPAAAQYLDEKAFEIFKLETKADDVYSLLYPDTSQRAGGSGWKTSPFVEKCL